MSAPPAPIFDKPGKAKPGTSPAVWLKTHRNVALGAGGAGVVGFALYKRSHPTASRSAAAAAATTADAGTGTDASGTYSSGSVDQYNALASSISELGDQGDALSGEVSSLQASDSALLAGETADVAANKSLAARLAALGKRGGPPRHGLSPQDKRRRRTVKLKPAKQPRKGKTALHYADPPKPKKPPKAPAPKKPVPASPSIAHRGGGAPRTATPSPWRAGKGPGPSPAREIMIPVGGGRYAHD
jgi:hypothetical protein